MDIHKQNPPANAQQLGCTSTGRLPRGPLSVPLLHP